MKHIHQKHTPENQPRYACFRCTNGCIHVVANNVMLTLSREQFSSLADAVDDFSQQLQAEEKFLSKRNYSEPTLM